MSKLDIFNKLDDLDWIPSDEEVQAVDKLFRMILSSSHWLPWKMIRYSPYISNRHLSLGKGPSLWKENKIVNYFVGCRNQCNNWEAIYSRSIVPFSIKVRIIKHIHNKHKKLLEDKWEKSTWTPKPKKIKSNQNDRIEDKFKKLLGSGKLLRSVFENDYVSRPMYEAAVLITIKSKKSKGPDLLRPLITHPLFDEYALDLLVRNGLITSSREFPMVPWSFVYKFHPELVKSKRDVYNIDIRDFIVKPSQSKYSRPMECFKQFEEFTKNVKENIGEALLGNDNALREIAKFIDDEEV